MLFRQYRPPAPLDRFVDNLWYWRGDPLPHRRELVMAAPRAGLLINLHEDALRHYEGEGLVAHRSRGIAINGPTTRHIAIDAFQPEIMGAQFKAGGTRPFFASSARVFSDLHVSVEDVWGGAEATRLHERLVAAPTIDAKFHMLEEAMLSKMVPVGRHPAVALALCRFHAAPMSTRVGEVAAESGWCRRRFIQLFTEEVGVTPKVYLRLLRFQGVLRGVFGATSVDWSEVAYDHGYADQPHLNREFREFAGLTPTQYLARPGSGANHAQLVETG
jgi:AraC-like DNA-binding protein